MLKLKLNTIVAVTALVVAVFGSTPLGQAAARVRPAQELGWRGSAQEGRSHGPEGEGRNACRGRLQGRPASGRAAGADRATQGAGVTGDRRVRRVTPAPRVTPASRVRRATRATRESRRRSFARTAGSSTQARPRTSSPSPACQVSARPAVAENSATSNPGDALVYSAPGRRTARFRRAERRPRSGGWPRTTAPRSPSRCTCS